MTVPSRRLVIALRIVQGLLALDFVGAAVWKLLTPVDQLAAMIPWAGQVSPGFLRAIALVDLAGGLGLVLPSLTRIKPRLAAVAALGCAALMVCAIVFHVARGEAANTPFNVVLLGLSLFVAWGLFRLHRPGASARGPAAVEGAPSPDAARRT